MRKLFLVLLVVAVSACTNDESLVGIAKSDVVTSRPYDPNRRNYAEAVEIAKNSIKMLQEGSPLTRGLNLVRTLDLKNGVKAIRQPVTRSNGSVSTNDTLFYIFNFNDNQGFAVVSASRQTDGLIAITELGSYDPTIPTGNPAFETYMQMAKAYVAHEDKTPIEDEMGGTRSGSEIRMYKPVYDTVFYQKIASRIAVRWGQRGRMGQYCPNGVAGCSNTAVAQIMSYFRYPSTLTLTYPGRDVNSMALDWAAMCNHVYTDCGENRDEADRQIGRLACQLGRLAGSMYYSYEDTDSNSTGTRTLNIRTAIHSLGYNVSPVINYNYQLNAYVTDPDAGYPLANLLAAGKLIYMRGSNSEDKGHAWVIDGCYYVKTLYRLMCSYDGMNWFVDKELGTYRTCYNHINWGINGAQNGYFNNNVFDMYKIFMEDPNINYLVSGQNVNFYNKVRYFSVWH